MDPWFIVCGILSFFAGALFMVAASESELRRRIKAGSFEDDGKLYRITPEERP